MNGRRLTLRLLPASFAICRLEPDAALPAWLPRQGFTACVRAEDELCIYCEETAVPQDVRAVRNWRALQLLGPFDFSESGVIAAVAGPLAEAGISIAVLATYDTDYIFVRNDALESAAEILQAAGLRV
ncbi:MAG TPA: ACT domain-containing protein, partial [Candidatus Acidoferrales bacterium]|nr:ACT domain-containing protein [Candidatus Acidoferrales bacterium]